jgi:hypothetical protein
VGTSHVCPGKYVAVVYNNDWLTHNDEECDIVKCIEGK